MNTVKEAFNHSFEQVGYDQEPEFKIHGIGYQGKWGKDTMATFIKDLEELTSGLTDTQIESAMGLESKIESLNSTIDGLNDEIKGLEEDNSNLEVRITALEEENSKLSSSVDELEAELREPRNE